LPLIDDALLVKPDKGAPIISEVQSHLDETTVRAIALQSTAGLRRGAGAHATGRPLEVPVATRFSTGCSMSLVPSARRGQPLPADAPRRQGTKLAR
jgi:F-type H+/Na+-transporting ATPase subunit beta